MSNAPSPVAPDGDPIGRNRLLARLAEEDRRILRPHLALCRLGRGDVLFEPGQEVESMHFPCDGTMISLVVVMRDGQTAETALIGCEGTVGGIVSRERRPAFARGVAQVPGEAWRIGLDALEEARARSPRLADLLARSADCLLAQLLQSVACRALHNLERRMARWLLAVQDRQGAGDLPLTQEYLGELLGVGRTYVTRTAAALQGRGLIAYARGRVRVLDRTGLESVACPCGRAIRSHFDRTLPGVYPGLRS